MTDDVLDEIAFIGVNYRTARAIRKIAGKKYPVTVVPTPETLLDWPFRRYEVSILDVRRAVADRFIAEVRRRGYPT